MSVSRIASSVRSGSPTELDTDQDYFHVPSGYRDGPLSSPGPQILVNGVLESPQQWIGFDDHPVVEKDEVYVYEDNYDDYEEPGDENITPMMPLSERRVSPPPPPTQACPTRAPPPWALPPRAPPVPRQGIRAGCGSGDNTRQYRSRMMVISKRLGTPSRPISRASLASEPASTSPSSPFRSSSTLRNEHHIKRTPPPSQPYRATPPTQACATPAPESVYGSDRGDVPAEAKLIISPKSSNRKFMGEIAPYVCNQKLCRKKPLIRLEGPNNPKDEG
ncbi:hypothetical protein P167DRAFT_549662 [Morchella conica CCBAS932]|uniref:Uncharacterized protein n=1 Tax=Morchella conica CCBAS932 TaxID=1392247 RepID=A0A3N4KDV8_9PEZI|nr:hypothetical protein P167DRAFT_549662 [Morchella conica CCBAS932]